MSNVQVDLPVPAGNGTGAAVDTSQLGPDKTVVIDGVFVASVTIEISEDGTDWAPVVTFTRPGDKNIQVVAQQMRVRIDAFGSGAPNVDVGADGAGGQFAAMNVPAGDGSGTNLNVKDFGRIKSVVVGGTLGGGTLNIQVSEDLVAWSDVASFITPGGQKTFEVEAQYMRVTRIGTTGGTPTVTIGASNDAEGIDGGIDVTAKIDGAVLNIYVDSVNGDDGNTGLSTTSALASITGLYKRFPIRAIQNSRIIVHLAGVGGFGASATGVADYDTVNLLVGGDGAPWGSTYVYRGPQMVPVVPTTGPATAALDVVPVVAIAGGAAAAGGTRAARFDFTAAVPGWTLADFAGAFLRITRAGALVIFEIPIHANTADTITVLKDGLAALPSAILATDTVEIVRPGARFINDTDPPTGFDNVRITGTATSDFDVQDLTPDPATGLTFTRCSWRSPFVTSGCVNVEFDRCLFPFGSTTFIDQSTVEFVNCSAGELWFLNSGGGGGGVWPNPDSATSPIVGNRGAFMNFECEFFNLGAFGIPGSSYVVNNGIGVRGNGVNDMILLGGGSFLTISGTDVQGIGGAGTDAGIRCIENSYVRCDGNVARAGSLSVQGAAGDLIVTAGIPTLVPYGVGAGDFEEGAGWNGNLQRFPVLPGQLGDASIITTHTF